MIENGGMHKQNQKQIDISTYFNTYTNIFTTHIRKRQKIT